MPKAKMDKRIKVRFKKVFINSRLLGYKDTLKVIISKNANEHLHRFVLLAQNKYIFCNIFLYITLFLHLLNLMPMG
jgi:hypothetical protein